MLPSFSREQTSFGVRRLLLRDGSRTAVLRTAPSLRVYRSGRQDPNQPVRPASPIATSRRFDFFSAALSLRMFQHRALLLSKVHVENACLTEEQCQTQIRTSPLDNWSVW